MRKGESSRESNSQRTPQPWHFRSPEPQTRVRGHRDSLARLLRTFGRAGTSTQSASGGQIGRQTGCRFLALQAPSAQTAGAWDTGSVLPLLPRASRWGPNRQPHAAPLLQEQPPPPPRCRRSASGNSLVTAVTPRGTRNPFWRDQTSLRVHPHSSTDTLMHPRSHTRTLDRSLSRSP